MIDTLRACESIVSERQLTDSKGGTEDDSLIPSADQATLDTAFTTEPEPVDEASADKASTRKEGAIGAEETDGANDPPSSPDSLETLAKRHK